MAQEAVYIRVILEELGHEQPPTPLQTDNAMADKIVDGKITPKETKAMEFISRTEQRKYPLIIISFPGILRMVYL